MYRMACKDPKIESVPPPVLRVPGICENLHRPRPADPLYRKARAIRGQEGAHRLGAALRPGRAFARVCEGAGHPHVGGLLKIAPEHTEDGPLDKMMKPGIGTYDRFKEMFERFSKEAGKKQHLIYFIAAHPGTTDEDMVNLALWLKGNNFRLDQVQTFMPTPMAMATTMYHTGKNPCARCRPILRPSTPKSGRQRRLHKALLRYHDPRGGR
jgi:radical SAM superfamily enzyme YgiQ (UPF0313 family)